jgi:hypothetical protein
MYCPSAAAAAAFGQHKLTRQGTSADRRRCERTGKTTLKRRTHSYGLSTQRTASGSTTAGRSWRGCCWKRFAGHGRRGESSVITRLTRAAALGGQLAGVQEQKRCSRRHDRGRRVRGGLSSGSRGALGRVGGPMITDGVQGLGLDAIQTHKWAILSCSAMSGLNLHEGLQWVVQDAKARLFLY